MALVKHLIQASVAVAAIVGATNAANAADFVLVGVGPGDSSTFFGNTSTTSGAISDKFTFTVPSGVVSAFVGSIALRGKDIVLTHVDLDGIYNFTQDLTGVEEKWSLGNTMLSGGNHAINVVGTWGTSGGSYSGTLNFAAVPETGTWAMMALGLGLAGAAMRRSRRQKVSVRFA